ncbi:MAG: hydroxymethylglutaryl-CoA reductase [Flavobacteriales bacterium]|nr:hydroxymethylglutaryl-CoA reductase [Flavobacteriales bacterium]
MAFSRQKTIKALGQISDIEDLDKIIDQLRSRDEFNDKKSSFSSKDFTNPEAWNDRVDLIIGETNSTLDVLTNKKEIEDLSVLNGNIENYIGMSRIPTGVIGPITVNGTSARGEFYVPMATSEGALIASYHRGAKATRISGGIKSVCLSEGVQRAPLFRFDSIGDLGEFLVWLLAKEDSFHKIVAKTSRYAKLTDFKTNIEGNQLSIIFCYTTGDASGQNMVTICTEAICHWIIENAPIKPKSWFIEGNFSGDKKATAQSFLNVRGKKVTAEIEIPQEVLTQVLKTKAGAVAEYWQASTLGTVQSGSIGAQGHYANGLAAIFIATGQDVACVSEAAVGITRMEEISNGGLYVSVTLPNLIVGTVGGGTVLPTQKECLEMIDCFGQGKARKFAEICAAVVLSGELSIAAAIAAGHFTSAHEKLGR